MHDRPEGPFKIQNTAKTDRKSIQIENEADQEQEKTFTQEIMKIEKINKLIIVDYVFTRGQRELLIELHYSASGGLCGDYCGSIQSPKPIRISDDLDGELLAVIYLLDALIAYANRDSRMPGLLPAMVSAFAVETENTLEALGHLFVKRDAPFVEWIRVDEKPLPPGHYLPEGAEAGWIRHCWENDRPLFIHGENTKRKKASKATSVRE